MTIISNMQIELRPDRRAEAVEAFIKRKVFEECAEAIPGFLWARLPDEEDAPDRIAVISVWTEKAAFGAWVAHPVRAKQEADLAHYIAEPPRTVLYASRAEYDRKL